MLPTPRRIMNGKCDVHKNTYPHLVSLGLGERLQIVCLIQPESGKGHSEPFTGLLNTSELEVLKRSVPMLLQRDIFSQPVTRNRLGFFQIIIH